MNRPARTGKTRDTMQTTNTPKCNPAGISTWAKAVIATAVAIVASCAMAASAHAAFGLQSAGGALVDSSGDRSSQAGAHPNLVTEFNLNTAIDQDGFTVADGNVKDVIVDLPPGLVGNPLAVPACDPVDAAYKSGALCSPRRRSGWCASAKRVPKPA